jgi:hypothetical protein
MVNDLIITLMADSGFDDLPNHQIRGYRREDTFCFYVDEMLI